MRTARCTAQKTDWRRAGATRWSVSSRSIRPSAVSGFLEDRNEGTLGETYDETYRARDRGFERHRTGVGSTARRGRTPSRARGALSERLGQIAHELRDQTAACVLWQEVIDDGISLNTPVDKARVGLHCPFGGQAV